MPNTARSLRSPSLKAALVNPESFSSTLLVATVDLFGFDPILSMTDMWSPETFRLEFRDELQIEVPPTNIDRLMAAVSLVTTDDFFKRTPRFIQLCNILAGDDYDPRVFNPADSEEITWGVAEAFLLAGPEEEEPFSDEIQAYIVAVLQIEGILHPPDMLNFVMDEMRILSDTAIFDGDPDLFEVAYQEQTRQRNELNQMVKENMQELFGQLKALELENGDSADIVGRALKQNNER